MVNTPATNYSARVLPDWLVVVGGAGVEALAILIVEYKPGTVARTNTQDLYVCLRLMLRCCFTRRVTNSRDGG